MRVLLKWSGWLMLLAIATAASGMSSDTTPLSNMLPKMPRPPIDYSVSDIKPIPERERAADPLKYLAKDLDKITNDLSGLATARPVQDEQSQALAHMDALIAQLEKSQSKSGKNGTNPNPASPMTSSRITSGPGGEGALHSPKEGSKNWGDLPPKEREQILQARTEGFPAGYEGLLESYYRRLSQEQVTTDATTAPQLSHAADPAGHQAGHP